MFSKNRAGLDGGALFAYNGSALSWSAPSNFLANIASAGGALSITLYSSVSWNTTILFDSNNGGGPGGGVVVVERSAAVWRGSTTFTNNSAEWGGALDAIRSNVPWSGAAHSLFDGNTAGFGGVLV